MGGLGGHCAHCWVWFRGESYTERCPNRIRCEDLCPTPCRHCEKEICTDCADTSSVNWQAARRRTTCRIDSHNAKHYQRKRDIFTTNYKYGLKLDWDSYEVFMDVVMEHGEDYAKEWAKGL